MNRETKFLFIAALFITWWYIATIPDEHYVYRPNVVTWYESNVQIFYQNGSVDTVKIDVYENLDNIKIENGNMTYQKATKETGGTVAYMVKLSSYVRNFKVLSSELKSKSG